MVALYVVLIALIVLLVITSLVVLRLVPYMDRLKEVQSDIKIADRTLGLKNEELKNMEAQVQSAKDLINQKKEAEEFILTHEAELEIKRRELERLNNEIEELAKSSAEKIEENDKLTSENKELYQKNQDLELSIRSLDENIIKRDNELKGLNSTIEQLNTQKSELNAEIINLKGEISLLEKELDKLNNALKELKETKENLENKISKQSDALQEINTKIEQGKIATAPYQAIKENAKLVWEDLDNSIVSMEGKNLKSNTAVNEDIWLDKFKNNLKNNQIIFDERIINAFHTGLKVADNSPIMVLSGISGTGKSLLPQLYAQASGMNFIPVAVQPRWDSPQDMLGFYNYMQYKYKATELSRLLWQFDIFNNSNIKAQYADSTKLPMNLILLDEMNLARVEYYFSDLLSKLEVRRTIDENNTESRRAAEIEIECGSISAAAGGRRLFVGKNNLFVGTMNEDETTQTLSDKVVDRANVLRFGKPKKLQSNPTITDFNSIYSDDTYINLEQWRNLSNNTLSSTNANRLEDVITQINDALASVNRPFAHRVWQSIKSYVNAYPNVNSQTNFDYALSDQIEMKILPKLNGLSKDSEQSRIALNKINNTINNIRDEGLQKTYKSIVDDTENLFFQWKGVVR